MISCILIIILLIIAAISKAIMDVVSFRFERSIFFKPKKWSNWFNPYGSWQNKYKNRDPKQGKRFFGSTTFLVWMTDAWHFFQMIMISCFIISIIIGINYFLFPNLFIYKLLAVDAFMFIILKTIYGLIFELFWNKIFLK